MKCQPLNFKGTEGVVGLSQWLKKMESVFHISGCAIDNQVKFATCTLLGVVLTWWNGQRFQELVLMCTKFLADETEKVDKYISGLLDNIHRNVMSARPKTLDETIELANDLMDQKLHTYAEMKNENKRKADDSSRNSQQQPHKKQNVARVYTAGPSEKKVYTGDLPLCTKCNYHHTRQCAPKCGKYKRYGHTTTDCRVNTNNNNNNKNQKAVICYECGNTGHIKKNCLKLKNRRNGNGNSIAQGRAYALGGRDASPDANVIMGTFLLNNCYAKILFDIGVDRSFVSTTFSALIDITPTTFEDYYDVELANGKIIGVNTIVRGCSHSDDAGLRRPVQPARVCSYTDFMKCQPLNFKGTEGVVGLSQWLEKMESVFHISGCAIDNQVKFATCTLLGAALTWWNGHVRTLGHQATYPMTWGTLNKKMTDKYNPKGEIKKLKIELWNLKVKGNNVAAYTQRFQELALMCTKFLADETEKVDKYISGLPDNIYGKVMSARPKTLDETIELANDLMDQKLRTYAEMKNENKRKADD
nr:hypothetical protein [Tanacetum cinerariifolium]